MMRRLQFPVLPPDNGRDLLGFLAGKLTLSRRRAKDLLDRRNVFVNDRRVWMAKHSLSVRDQVTVVLPVDGADSPAPSAIRLLHSDGRYLVADKPPGLLSNGPDSVESRLRQSTGIATLQAVHRLDRDTSGCLLLAVDRSLFDQMVAVFREGRILKLYHVLVAGRLTGERVIEKPLEGQPAVTKLRVLDANAQASHLQVKIETGRTHQIRKHLAMIRHPVLGDREYGTAGPLAAVCQDLPRQMLHAAVIEFPDPETGRPVRAESPLPRDFRAALHRLGLS